MSNNDYILFYSNKCNHSKELLVLLTKDPELNKKFIKINIDTRGVKIPPYVKSVPSAIIPMNGSPSLLVGVNIFKWYDENHKVNVQSSSIMDYDPLGMAGYSDNFSFLDGKNEPLKKAFSFVNENFNIPTPDGNSMTGDNQSGRGGGGSFGGFDDRGGGRGGDRESHKKTQLDMEYEQRMNQRKLDVPMGPPRI